MILIRDAEVECRRVDVRIADGCVAEIGVHLDGRPGEEVLVADGGALLPGLVDHHLHLHALAAAARSTPCGPPEVRDPAGLAAALAAARTDEHRWIRGVGYHESVAGHLDAAALDRLHAARPVRLQHRSGALWVVNGAGAQRLGLADATYPGIERTPDGAPTGRLWRADDWMRSRLPSTGPPNLAAVGDRLARLGITAVTDATPDLEPAALDALAAAVTTGVLPQRVHLLGVPLGVAPRAPLTAGPYKIVLADSGLPDLDTLTATIGAAHALSRPVAVHCVTREAFVLLLTALHDAGCVAGDRIEHAALVPAELVGDLARRGLRVVTQPGFLAHRGDDYLRDLPATDHPDLYRCRSLLDAGVPVALSSDAPYGPLDPWTVLAAAAHRRTPSGAVAGRAERLAPADALDAYLAPPEDPGGPPRRIRPGTPADLALLDRPLEAVLTDPSLTPVRATFIAGYAHVPASGTSVG
ncbi:amidohydrolase family protein [Pseudonocardia kunmingensis]|uniref:Putative amidohydrolase YtcJ n=1 Tax=Pseudonocardia kunmingensis TaxID=630975 RepID=A0A543DQ09_9PSEU|nr:amidohydrolase family protein [Pseudonocardia kunmingensis]TQM11395.1 putative amidohydrolase YtcJ [Pseudonocardia kunmingensis]